MQFEIEKMFRLIFEGARDAIFWADAETGMLLHCNKAAEQLIEAPRSEIVGQHFTCLHPPDIKDQVISLFASLSTHWDLETEVLSRSGRRIPVLIRNSTTVFADTHIIQGAFLDISKRKRAEHALIESEAKYRAMVEAFDGLMFICSRDRKIEFMNHQMIQRVGYDATGENCYEALHTLESICPWCVNDRVFNGESVQMDFQSPKDGRWYKIVNNPIRNREETVSKQVTITDITVQKKAEQYRVAFEAESIALAEQRQFMGLVSHEIKTPLSIIDGAAQLILLTAPADSGCLQQASRIRAASMRLNELIDSCLTDDRLSTTGWNPDLQIHDLRIIITNAIEQSRTGVGNHIIHADIKALPGQFLCDALLMQIMIANLLDNAKKYSPEGGDITLIGRTDHSGRALIEITDNGIGIPPEETEKIFERFYRTWQTPGVAGAGLGLNLVKRIATIHNGTVTCESTPNEGTTFTVTLAPTP